MSDDEKKLIRKAIFAKRLQRLIDISADGNVFRFSKKVGISRTTINSWRDETSEPKRDKLKQLIERTGKSEEYFFPDENESTPEPAFLQDAQLAEDVQHLHTIYDYGDSEIINAIHSNLKTFNRTVQREIEVKNLKKEVKRLNEKCEDMEKRETERDREMSEIKEQVSRILNQQSEKKSVNA